MISCKLLCDLDFIYLLRPFAILFTGTLLHFRISLSRMREGTAKLDEDTQLELDVKCLQILRALIYNKFIYIDPEDKERNPEIYRA